MIWIAHYFAGAYIMTALWTWVESFSLMHALHNQRTGSLHPSHNSTTASSEPHDLHSFSIYCEPPVSNIMCVSTYLFLFFQGSLIDHIRTQQVINFQSADLLLGGCSNYGSHMFGRQDPMQRRSRRDSNRSAQV